MALAMINSFYMKEPLSPMIRHQVKNNINKAITILYVITEFVR